MSLSLLLTGDSILQRRLNSGAYADYQTLKAVSKHHTWLAVYDGSRDYRRFESADGTTGKDYSFAWNAAHRAEAQPEVQFHFWRRIEEQWEKLGKPVAG